MDIHLLNVMMSSDKFKEERAYWQKQLDGDIHIGTLFDRIQQPSIQTSEPNVQVLSLSFPDELSARLIRMSGGSNLALYILLLSGFQHLLYRYYGQPDMLLGMPLTPEQVEDFRSAHLLAIRGKVDETASFRQLVLHTKAEVMSARTYWHFPYDKMAEKLGRIPEECALKTVLYMKGIHEEPILDERTQCSLGFDRVDQRLHMTLRYGAIPLEPSQPDRLCSHYIRLLEQTTALPDQPLSMSQILSLEEENEIMEEWNRSPRLFLPEARSVCAQFLEQVNKAPEQTAVIEGERQISYHSLEEQSNQLARLLITSGVTAESSVPVMMAGSIELIITILAVFKAGGTYIPLHPEYPLERVRHILMASNARILLTGLLEKDVHQALEEMTLAMSSGSGIAMMKLDDAPWRAEDGSGLRIVPDMNGLAYILYTSGSTGEPKGVGVEQRNLSAYVNAFQAEFQLNATDRVLQQAASTFDTYMEEVFPALTAGATLVVVQREQLLDIQGLVQLLDRHQVTLVSTTPHILKELNRMPNLTSVRTFISGGDVLKVADIGHLLTYTDVYNTYGPTETTVCALYEKLSSESMDPIPVGRPIQGYFVHIGDHHGRMLPVGVPGEICISGKGVSRGYIGLQELTEQKFSESPFVEGARMFRTGDTGMWTAEGRVLFLGRMDKQVKVRGHRIELAEVERHLNRYGPIAESVVLTTGVEGEKVLTAYIVADTELYVMDIRQYLISLLPEYMLPSKYIQISHMPRTIHGKIDTRELLNQKQSLHFGMNYAPPETELQHQLVNVWCTLLEMDQIGIDDDFFQLGGHSLLVIRMEVELENLGIRVLPSILYDNPTIRMLATVLEENPELGDSYASENHGQVSGIIKVNKTLSSMDVEHSRLARSDGYHPFNDVFFKLCFYNSLFPIVLQQKKSILPFFIHHVDEYLWSEKKQFLVNGFVSCRKDTDILDDLGVGYEMVKISEDIIQDVSRAVLDARPVIVWVDVYYTSIRNDTYLKKHIPHTWLVYGADPINQTFTVMEHKHHDNLSYEERTVSYQDLSDSYHGYIEHFNMENHTFYTFYNKHYPVIHQRDAGAKQLEDYWKIYVDHIEEQKERVEKSLVRLEESVPQFEFVVQDPHLVSSMAEDWVISLHKLISAKKAEVYRCANLTGADSQLTHIRERIVMKWSDIRAVLAKYVLTSSYKPTSFHKLPEMYRNISVLEREYYDELVQSYTTGRI
ncbi:amino acid adenylation domain-containing protein [Paenibacillus sp. FSL R5-0519]|uniref:amino acid adenylation domain-containing protein n=1 Tax=Paenibacillus sp. FSL R5-0519 TaxID=2921648 RepID=UPI0030DD9E5A